MSKFLVVFEEAGGPETYLEDTREEAVERIQRIRDECNETDADMEDSTTIYEVVASFNYQAPVEASGLIKERSF